MNFTHSPSSPYAIGAEVRIEFDATLALLEKLRGTSSSDETDLLFEPAKEILAKAITSISFIGQVKAGKTSLVNAMIAKPNFLPSDVNPWTAVVTRIFFDKPNGPRKGAHFSFFDDEQWDKFANRGGRLSELAAEIPESDEKLNDIRLEVNQMRERAKRQLGDKFQSLMGQTHRFNNATTDVLARYICVGDDPEALVTQNVQGRYADITREAAVFFEKEKFAVPVVLVDTPGLNDPLMIREEITLQSLEHSHVFVLVLSAHQAFSSADLYLVRILNALRLDRLVIFVNRVDELTNPETDIPEIRKHITKFMAKERPGAKIPILFGSAACANNAITGNSSVDSARAASLLASSVDAAQAKSNTEFDSQQQQEAWQASGLPVLEQALSQMIFEGPGHTWLTGARIELNNATKIMLAKTEAAIDALRQQKDNLNNENKRFASLPQKLKFDTEHFETECDRLFGGLRLVVEQNMNSAWFDIKKGLQDITERFIGAHDHEFAVYLLRAKASKTQIPWSCDTTPLRRELNQYLGEEFPRIQASVLENIEQGVETISKSMVDAGLSAAEGLRINTATLAGQSVSTSALSKIVPIDMDSSWWRGWMSKFMRSSKIRDSVAKMIRAQFRPIQDELMDGMSNQLVTSSTKAMTSYQDTLNSLAEVISTETKQPVLTTIEDIDSRIDELEVHAKVCKEVSLTLQQTLEA